MDISSRAILVSTHVRVWGGEKRDKTISREICDQKGAAENAVRANKSLLGDAIGSVQAAERAVRQAVNERTLPWLDDGTRVLKGATFMAFTEAVGEHIRAFDQAVDIFVTAYPTIKEHARIRLGQAFHDSDFPPQRSLRERFGVKLTYLPVPSSDDFRVQLAAEEIEAVRRNAEEAIRNTVQDAVRDLLDRLREPVAHMATRLRLMRRHDNGRTEHPFRDSLVENVRAIVRLAPALNLLDDPRISQFCAEIERNLTGYDAVELRASPHLRQDIADRADDILRRMEGAF